MHGGGIASWPRMCEPFFAQKPVAWHDIRSFSIIGGGEEETGAYDERGGAKMATPDGNAKSAMA